MAVKSLGSLPSIHRLYYNAFRPLVQKSFSSCVDDFEDTETHTGQKWEKNDYRLVRFVDKNKQVNPNWAVKLIAEVPPVCVTERVVCCDGGSGPTGHPKIYINLDKPGNHSCLYCGLRFYKEH